MIGVDHDPDCGLALSRGQEKTATGHDEGPIACVGARCPPGLSSHRALRWGMASRASYPDCARERPFCREHWTPRVEWATIIDMGILLERGEFLSSLDACAEQARGGAGQLALIA